MPSSTPDRQQPRFDVEGHPVGLPLDEPLWHGPLTSDGEMYADPAGAATYRPATTEDPAMGGLGPVERLAARLDAAARGECSECGHPLAGCTCGPAVTVDELADVRGHLLATCERAVRHGQADVAAQLRDVIGALVDAEAAARRQTYPELTAAQDRLTEAERVLLVDRPEGPALTAAEAEAEAAYAALERIREAEGNR